MVYEKHQIASSSVISADARLSYIGIFNIVEDAITECMGEQGLDNVTVKRNFNAFWVFTKNKVKLFSNLVWGERFVVQSFISSLSSAKMVVDTALKKENGTIVAYSSCEMCVLDIATGRIRRTASVGAEGICVEPSQCEIVFDKIDDSNLPQVEEVKVRSTNVDYSRHCNNVEYLRFVFNTYNVDELTSLPIKEIEVCYVAQSYENDTLTVHKSVSDSRDLISVKKDGCTVIKCIVTH